ncbi:unnamed protein product [Linum trigynum]|uniref:Uncharacterized protein n=1 Tax=Linum trigynum TaxID=586398 RepID=A0AAV2F8I8_9ROSI
MVNMDHPYLVALRSIPEMEREVYFCASLRVDNHWKLDFSLFDKLHYGDVMREAVVHPQWRQALDLEDDTYGELCVEFFSTFTIHKILCLLDHPVSRVEFRLGGEIQNLSYDELARALGVEVKHEDEWEEDAIRSFDVNPAFLKFCLPKYRRTKFKSTCTTTSTLQPQWRVIVALLARSLYTAYHNPNKIIERILLACYCMADRSSTMHLLMHPAAAAAQRSSALHSSHHHQQ